MTITTSGHGVLKANDPCWCGSGKKFKRCHKAATDRVRPGQVSPMRPVPASIPRPPYAESGRLVRVPESPVHSPDVIERMRRAGRAAAEVLAETAAAIRPGVTTDELDAICHQACIDRGGYPSPLNYSGFPKSLCTSVNEVICHGIPDDTPLRDGDLVNIDITAYVGGVHGDTDATYLVGDVAEEDRLLVERTKEALDRAIRAVRPGRPINVVGRVIESYARRFGYGVVRDFTGHGIGTAFHSGLVIPHYDDPAATTIMQPGMTFTIEPMLNQGTHEWAMWDDGWTVVTKDGRRSAQFEHTILVTEDGAEVLTRA